MDLVGDCWEWYRAKTHDGYGRVSGGKMAHRVLYELMVAKVPEGMQLDHLCRNRACVNPEHLEPVFPRENLMRGNTPARFNAEKTHCLHGHPLSGRNLAIGPDGKRRCRECSRIRVAKSRARKEANAL